MRYALILLVLYACSKKEPPQWEQEYWATTIEKPNYDYTNK